MCPRKHLYVQQRCRTSPQFLRCARLFQILQYSLYEQVLLDQGANIDAVGDEHKTPLQLATQKRYPFIVLVTPSVLFRCYSEACESFSFNTEQKSALLRVLVGFHFSRQHETDTPTLRRSLASYLFDLSTLKTCAADSCRARGGSEYLHHLCLDSTDRIY